MLPFILTITRSDSSACAGKVLFGPLGVAAAFPTMS